MNREADKILEYEIGRAFFGTLNEGKVETLIHDDNPDFFTTEAKHTGIELTQIFNLTSNGDSRVYIEGSWNNLLIKLKKIWDTRSLPACNVKLNFIQPIIIPNTKIDQIAEDIINLISDFVPEPISEFRSPDSMVINIPNLNGFVIERLIDYDMGSWSYYDSIWPSTLNPDYIQTSINKKEKKREEYLKRCNEIWLVIALYGSKASGSFLIPENTINHNYECNFDRLFLFDCCPKRLYKLNFTKQLS